MGEKEIGELANWQSVFVWSYVSQKNKIQTQHFDRLLPHDQFSFILNRKKKKTNVARKLHDLILPWSKWASYARADRLWHKNVQHSTNSFRTNYDFAKIATRYLVHYLLWRQTDHLKQRIEFNPFRISSTFQEHWIFFSLLLWPRHEYTSDVFFFICLHLSGDGTFIRSLDHCFAFLWIRIMPTQNSVYYPWVKVNLNPNSDNEPKWIQ